MAVMSNQSGIQTICGPYILLLWPIKQQCFSIQFLALAWIPVLTTDESAAMSAIKG
jgi:hypothetical protein